MTESKRLPDELVAALVDGTLTDTERKRLLAELAARPDEIESVALLRRLTSILPEIQEVTVPQRVVDRAMTLVRKAAPAPLLLRASIRLEAAALSVLQHTATLLSTRQLAPQAVRGGTKPAESVLLSKDSGGRRLTLELRPESERARVRVSVQALAGTPIPDGAEARVEGPEGEASVYFEGGEADLGLLGRGMHVIRVEELGSAEIVLE